MTVEITPCTPGEFWGDDETPPTGHRPADLSPPDGRLPLEDTPTYLRRLTTELKEARAWIARHRDTDDGCVPGATFLKLTADLAEARDTITRVEALTETWLADTSDVAGVRAEHWRGPDYVDGRERAFEKCAEDVHAALGPAKPGCYCGTDHA